MPLYNRPGDPAFRALEKGEFSSLVDYYRSEHTDTGIPCLSHLYRNQSDQACNASFPSKFAFTKKTAHEIVVPF